MGVFLYGALTHPLLLRVLVRPTAALPGASKQPIVVIFTAFLGGSFFMWFMSRLCRTANRTQTDRTFRIVGQAGAYGVAASFLTFELLILTTSLWITIQLARVVEGSTFSELVGGFWLDLLGFHTYLLIPFIQLTPLTFLVGAIAGIFVLRACKDE
jgi:hypothetical protein